MRSSTNIFKRTHDAYAAGYEPEGLRRLSDIYWRALLVGAFLLLVCVFLYSTWGLLRVLEDLGATANSATPPPSPLNRALLNETLHAFETRQSQFQTFKTNPPAAIPDPSR